MEQSLIRVGIIGVTGYAGQQLLWILAQHPSVSIEALSSRSYAGEDIADVFPNYRDHFSQLLLAEEEFRERIPHLDLLFMALPHGLSQNLAELAIEHNVKVVDLGADFRFDDVAEYETWYQAEHLAKALNEEAVYGMPELHRQKIARARIVASPGCYPTSAILGVAPLIEAGVVNPKTVIVDAKSGTTGAGRATKRTSLYCEVNESFKAYGVLTHRHRPEIEQELSNLTDQKVEIIFTPHLLPTNRGILSTIYLDLLEDRDESSLYKLYEDFYRDEPFVRITQTLPELHNVTHTNLCDIGIRVDRERRKVVVISAIDNLIKGAAGQAVQSMNLLFNRPEEEGLTFLSMFI